MAFIACDLEPLIGANLRFSSRALRDDLARSLRFYVGALGVSRSKYERPEDGFAASHFPWESVMLEEWPSHARRAIRSFETGGWANLRISDSSRSDEGWSSFLDHRCDVDRMYAQVVDAGYSVKLRGGATGTLSGWAKRAGRRRQFLVMGSRWISSPAGANRVGTRRAPASITLLRLGASVSRQSYARAASICRRVWIAALCDTTARAQRPADGECQPVRDECRRP